MHTPTPNVSSLYTLISSSSSAMACRSPQSMLVPFSGSLHSAPSSGHWAGDSCRRWRDGVRDIRVKINKATVHIFITISEHQTLLQFFPPTTKKLKGLYKKPVRFLCSVRQHIKNNVNPCFHRLHAICGVKVKTKKQKNINIWNHRPLFIGTIWLSHKRQPLSLILANYNEYIPEI